MFAWMKLLRELSPAALTVVAQAISADDNGRLQWNRFFPRREVPSVRLANITTLDDRATADRREWDAPGRRIPLVTPSWRELEMIPIEAEHVIDEYEMQLLSERTGGNAAVIQQTLMTSIPDRVRTLVAADYRRVEVDAFTSWANGNAVVRNPQDGTSYTVTYGFDAARISTAGTAWNDVGVNAWTLFLAWLQAGEDAVGLIEGVMIRRATLNAIQADAPVSANMNVMTQTILEQMVTDVMGNAFRFEVNESTVDIFTDGGLTRTRTKIWPTGKVAAIPAGTEVGTTGFAPVVRAMEIANQVPGAGIDTNGATAFYFERNDGKELVLQAQMNALTIPDEQRVYVIAAGV